MKILKIIETSIFQMISVLFVVGFLLGVLNLHFSDKNNYCVMTYMYEFPQFVEIVFEEYKHKPQYGLYAYSEGRLTEKARKMWFDGVPVLYIPGNSGSHMQARSLASVALRKALTNDYDYHFDFFTVKYNEELSGLYGGVLERQTLYATDCITKILCLYKSNEYIKTVPTTVILIGHSMGGLIAKRLLAFPRTLNTTSVAITLAAPLQAPVINFDSPMSKYYKEMENEWEVNINGNENVRQRKLLLSFGSGPRDILMPSWLTSSNDSYIGALTTAVPGVWVSTDHVSIVWCKQLVLAINKYLFSIIDPFMAQIKEDTNELKTMARQIFQANRSMFLNPDIVRQEATMQVDAFWYEDNRRIYQVSRPGIEKTTYLMIRLVTFPQNRFVAVEAVNVDDRDWIFGCSAKYTYRTYRYCKKATSLTELSRWTGAAPDFGKRKLATIHLHSIKDQHPEWTHVIVKVSPTRKPVVMNVDINDHSSRQISVSLPSYFSFGKTEIIAETENASLYYELLLPDFELIHEAYLLYVEPSASCKAIQYHVSAELSVPWAKNQEYYHYFTQSKLSPMKLRLLMSNPNATLGLESHEHPKITLLLDPQCTFTISISNSWYHRLGQLVRNYTTVLIPYIAAILLLAARSNMLSLMEDGTCMSIHGALLSEGVKPYYALVFARLTIMVVMSFPFLAFILENGTNQEMLYFVRSLIVLPAYMTALGLLNIAAAAAITVMVFSSQLAHRLLFRIVWRGGGGIAERVASALQRLPVVVAVILTANAPLSCGAASLAVGAAFYAFMISKMYEEYLEDYIYKLMAKIASRICRLFKSKKTVSNNESGSSLIKTADAEDNIETEAIEGNKSLVDNKSEITDAIDEDNEKENDTELKQIKDDGDAVSNDVETVAVCTNGIDGDSVPECDDSGDTTDDVRFYHDKYFHRVGDDLNSLNFHMMMFFLWITLTLINLPALITWARNFKYSIKLYPDTSFVAGMVLSTCSFIIWQVEGPKKKLKHYETLARGMFTLAVCILVVGPFSLTFVNYGLTFVFALITMHQVLEHEEEQFEEDPEQEEESEQNSSEEKDDENNTNSDKDDQTKETSDNDPKSDSKSDLSGNDSNIDNCDVCNESRIYNIFKNLKEKFSFNED